MSDGMCWLIGVCVGLAVRCLMFIVDRICITIEHARELRQEQDADSEDGAEDEAEEWDEEWDE
jgi:hypothetical protein